MQVIEERLMLLEAWLHEDPYQEDVNHKRDEYLSLMEELEILGKKMRKTDKMLALPNQPNIGKLERKREQYEREVTDIVLYAEQDTFFDLDGENGEAAMVAYMKANSLLGKPLETLAEMPGFEDSKAWNDSFGALDTRSIREERSSDVGSSPKGRKKNRNNKNSNNEDDGYNNSTAQLDLSQPYNITVLKKKLKKAKQLLEDTTSEKERKRLFKKISEYKDALATAEILNQRDNDDEETTTEGDDDSHASEESIDPPIRSPVKVFAPKPNPNANKWNNNSNVTSAHSTNGNEEPEEEEEEDDSDEAMYRLLKRKLSKATRLAKSSATSKTRHKYQRKVEQYLASLNQYDAWKNDQLAYGYDAGHSVEEESHETEWMEQQAAADEQRMAHEELQHQETQRRRTHAKTMLDSRKFNQEISPKDPVKKKDSSAPSSSSSQSSSSRAAPSSATAKVATGRNGSASEDESLDLEKYVDDERKQSKILRKKLAKVEGMIDDKLQQEGDEARYTKEFRKLQKKRKQYLTELGEDHASLANLSLGGSSMNMSSSGNPYDSASFDTSSNSFRIEDMIEEDDEEERNYQKARQARLQEHQRIREERLASARDKKPSSTHNDDEDDEEMELVRKKLKKVGKMLTNTEKGSKEYAKLLKKKKEYLAQLGEAG